MWIIFSIFAVLWFLGIHLYFPPAVSLIFFGLMLMAAVIAVWKPEPTAARRK